MTAFTLVTGNAHKVSEWQRLTRGRADLSSHELDLDEIQSLDPKIIVEHKVRQAYDALQQPVVVEDISASLLSLNGLPGPFIKFFIQQLGHGALYQLSKDPETDTAIATCTVGYYDGERLIIVEGNVTGKVVPLRGQNGFGFDKVFLSDGHKKTLGEMTPEEKDAMSHRRHAVDALLKQLEQV